MIQSLLLSALLAWPAAAQAVSGGGGRSAVDAGHEIDRLLRKLYEPTPPAFDDLVRSLARVGPAAAEVLTAIYVGAVPPPLPPENAASAPRDPAVDAELPTLEDVVLAALRALPPGEAVAAVRSRAMGDVPMPVRANGFRILGAVGTTRGLESLLQSAGELSEFDLARPGVNEPAADAVASILAGSDSDWAELEKRSTKLRPGLERIVVRGIGRSGSPRGFAVLMRMLVRRDANKALLYEALEQLSLKSAPWIEARDREEIRVALDFADADIRCRAAFILGRAGDADSVPSLLSFLDDENPLVRQAGLWALETMSGVTLGTDSAPWREWHDEQVAWLEDSLPGLQERLRSHEPTTAFDAIAEMCRRPLYRHRLAEDLADSTRHEEVGVAVAACAALGELRSPFAVPALVDALRRPEEEVRAAAGLALRTITGLDLPAEFGAWSGEIRP